MSAFMVEDHTINYVVDWLRRQIDELSIIPKKLQKIGIEMNIPD
jgi:hypothetical protein